MVVDPAMIDDAEVGSPKGPEGRSAWKGKVSGESGSPKGQGVDGAVKEKSVVKADPLKALRVHGLFDPGAMQHLRVPKPPLLRGTKRKETERTKRIYRNEKK